MFTVLWIILALIVIVMVIAFIFWRQWMQLLSSAGEGSDKLLLQLNSWFEPRKNALTLGTTLVSIAISLCSFSLAAIVGFRTIPTAIKKAQDELMFRNHSLQAANSTLTAAELLTTNTNDWNGAAIVHELQKQDEQKHQYDIDFTKHCFDSSDWKTRYIHKSGEAIIEFRDQRDKAFDLTDKNSNAKQFLMFQIDYSKITSVEAIATAAIETQPNRESKSNLAKRIVLPVLLSKVRSEDPTVAAAALTVCSRLIHKNDLLKDSTADPRISGTALNNEIRVVPETKITDPRDSNREPKADPSYAIIDQVDFQSVADISFTDGAYFRVRFPDKVNLSRINLARSRFNYSTFSSGVFEGTIFKSADLNRTIFEKDCEFSGEPSFEGAKLYGTEFRNCKLKGLSFEKATNVFRLTFKECSISDCNFNGIECEKAPDGKEGDEHAFAIDFENCLLAGSGTSKKEITFKDHQSNNNNVSLQWIKSDSSSEIDMKNVRFAEKTNWRKLRIAPGGSDPNLHVMLDNVDLVGNEFRGGELDRVVFRGGDIGRSFFKKISLKNILFSGVDCVRTVFHEDGSEIEGVVFDGCDLRCAYFPGSDKDGSLVGKCKIDCLMLSPDGKTYQDIVNDPAKSSVIERNDIGREEKTFILGVKPTIVEGQLLFMFESAIYIAGKSSPVKLENYDHFLDNFLAKLREGSAVISLLNINRDDYSSKERLENALKEKWNLNRPTSSSAK